MGQTGELGVRGTVGGVKDGAQVRGDRQERQELEEQLEESKTAHR